jgi:hypothetical protein
VLIKAFATLKLPQVTVEDIIHPPQLKKRIQPKK